MPKNAEKNKLITEKKDNTPVVVTIYLNNPEEPFIRFKLDSKDEARVLRNQIGAGVPYLLSDPSYADVASFTSADVATYIIKAPKKGLSIWISPYNVTHIYVDELRKAL